MKGVKHFTKNEESYGCVAKMHPALASYLERVSTVVFAVRIRLFLTQAKMGKKMGCSQAQISYIENENRMSIDQLWSFFNLIRAEEDKLLYAFRLRLPAAFELRELDSNLLANRIKYLKGVKYKI